MESAAEEEQRSRAEALTEENARLRDELTALRQQVDDAAAAAADLSARADGQGDSLLARQQAAGGGGSASAGGPGTGESDRRRSFGVVDQPSSSWARAFPKAGLPASLKFPQNGSAQQRVAWRNRLEMYLHGEGLSRVISREAPLIPVNGEGSDDIDHRYNLHVVSDHRRVFSILLEAVSNASFESRLHRRHSAPEAWHMITCSVIPQTIDERYLLEQELEHVRYVGEEHPDAFLARVDGMLNTLSLAGVKKSESDIVRIIVRQLPDRLYEVEKRSRLTDPTLSRVQIEGIIRSAYARQGRRN